jgi:hypothetical protein
MITSCENTCQKPQLPFGPPTPGLLGGSRGAGQRGGEAGVLLHPAEGLCKHPLCMHPPDMHVMMYITWRPPGELHVAGAVIQLPGPHSWFEVCQWHQQGCWL